MTLLPNNMELYITLLFKTDNIIINNLNSHIVLYHNKFNCLYLKSQIKMQICNKLFENNFLCK